MCGIPMLPPPDRARGRKLTFKQAMAHIGGYENMLTAENREEIAQNVRHYLWKYPDGTCWCTACGRQVGDMRARHGAEVSCPLCRQAAQFRHEARGHKKLFDEFDYRHWRRSAIDPETVILTITQVWRDSRHARPEEAELNIKPTAIYLFRLGCPTTVYKNHYWREDEHTPDHWHLQKDVRPENTFGGMYVPAVEDFGRMRDALRGTGLGRVYEMVRARPYRDADIKIIANCAVRPWLEYLAKSGQLGLAMDLADEEHVSREIVPRPKAKTPRELLGLTEGQWYEVRKQGIAIDTPTLRTLRAMGRMGWRAPKIAEAVALRTSRATRVSPDRPDPDSIDALTRGLPDKLRRGIFRASIRDVELTWRKDYYKALRICGEDMTDSALMLPRDLRAMHDRFAARAADIIEGRKQERLRQMERAARPKIEALREKYGFSACGLTLRPYETVREIMDEGRTLHICIGSYVDRYFNGDTIICCLRRAEEPDEPFHAVEFSAASGRIVQDRGLKNTETKREKPGTRRQIEAFWRAFERHDKRRSATR